MVIATTGRCAFCGRVHPMGDARTPEDCNFEDVMESLTSAAGIHRAPLAEDLPLGHVDDAPGGGA